MENLLNHLLTITIAAYSKEPSHSQWLYINNIFALLVGLRVKCSLADLGQPVVVSKMWEFWEVWPACVSSSKFPGGSLLFEA